jgi:hypothetical protein
MLNTKAVALIAGIHNQDPAVLREIVAKLAVKIHKWKRSEGLVNLVSRLKESEKHFLLTGKSK